jgi:tRNA 2-thiouridine synthesizing protein A
VRGGIEGIIASMQTQDPDVLIVDARGLFCPEPLVRARAALRMVGPAAVVELWATDPLAALDIEALCARGSCQYLGCTTDDAGVLRIRIRAV